MAPMAAILSQTRRDEPIMGCRDTAPARRRYIDGMMSLYEGNPFLSRLLLEAGPWFVFRAVVSLQAGFDERDRSSWPTLRLLQQELQELGLASPRRTHDIVARLIHTGFVAARPLACDRRVRILTPTARMDAHHRASTDALSGAVSALSSGARARPQGGAVAELGAVLRAARALQDNAPMLFFLQREAGIAVLMTLIRRGDDDHRQPVCFAEVGRNFGVSRTHVRLLLQEAARLGHLVGSGGHFSVAPATMVGFDRFVAQEVGIVADGTPLRVPLGEAAAA